GLKEKALAAHRGGITRIVFPKENENDVEEIPPTVRATLELIPVSNVDEVLYEALICADNKEFDKLLDRRTMKNELLYADQKNNGEDDHEGQKEKTDSAVVTH
ncbi:MAG: hypothetical protein DCC75_09340, partial [Proteobacteria bacterium]